MRNKKSYTVAKYGILKILKGNLIEKAVENERKRDSCLPVWMAISLAKWSVFFSPTRL